MLRIAGISALTAALVLAVGCGGDDTSAPAVPQPTIGGDVGTATKTTTEKTKTKTQPKTSSGKKKTALPVEVACGTIYFPPLGKNVKLTAAELPCGKAKAYATKFVSSDQPSQKNLPPGWRFSDCTGVGDQPPTPGEPNSPRCSKGSQAFTIHFSG